jgi:hypothetical protein
MTRLVSASQAGQDVRGGIGDEVEVGNLGEDVVWPLCLCLPESHTVRFDIAAMPVQDKKLTEVVALIGSDNLLDSGCIAGKSGARGTCEREMVAACAEP